MNKCPEVCQEQQTACIPFFVAENQMMHADRTNQRLLAALICVCITFILTIVIFVCGYTVREKNWLNTLSAMNVEVADGLHQQPDP